MQTKDIDITVDSSAAMLKQGDRQLIATIVSPKDATFSAEEPPSPMDPENGRKHKGIHLREVIVCTPCLKLHRSAPASRPGHRDGKVTREADAHGLLLHGEWGCRP